MKRAAAERGCLLFFCVALKVRVLRDGRDVHCAPTLQLDRVFRNATLPLIVSRGLMTLRLDRVFRNATLVDDDGHVVLVLRLDRVFRNATLKDITTHAADMLRLDRVFRNATLQKYRNPRT